MRTALICGSLEPGCDGVGDYSRALAGELIRQGRETCVVSLEDRAATKVVEETQEDSGMAVQALRIPALLSWTEKVEEVRGFFDRTGISHVSFQFVPYTYSPKGLVKRATPYLVQVAAGRKVHAMFHELWIGNHRGASLKDRIIGALQRHQVIRLFRRLAPTSIHTSNPAYAAFLARDGFTAEVLPLFGNIPVVADPGLYQARAIFREAGVDLSESARKNQWIAGIFGTIPTEWTPDAFFAELATTAGREKREVVIAGMGRFGAIGDQRWSETVRKWSDRFRFALLGKLPAEQLSHIFRVLNFGISTTPWRNFGKSSTGASMTDHGLPIVATRDDWRPRLPSEVDYGGNPLLRRFDPGFMNVFASFLAMKREPFGTRPVVAQRFAEAVFAK